MILTEKQAELEGFYMSGRITGNSQGFAAIVTLYAAINSC
jgi:hypothetical protein